MIIRWLSGTKIMFAMRRLKWRRERVARKDVIAKRETIIDRGWPHRLAQHYSNIVHRQSVAFTGQTNKQKKEIPSCLIGETKRQRKTEKESKVFATKTATR